MLHHISFPVSDLERSARFYDAALAALGFRRVGHNRELCLNINSQWSHGYDWECQDIYHKTFETLETFAIAL